MIISASRRTDIAAFYSRWFMNRIRAGFCTVPNPYNRQQVTQISLHPEDVDAIVFWTRNPRPLFSALDELDARGYRYYFQYTLMNNPPQIDPHKPTLEAALHTFRTLAARISPQRIIWRYDPIVLSNRTDSAFHLEQYGNIAAALQGYTTRSVISLMDPYRKALSRLQALSAQGIDIAADHPARIDIAPLMNGLKAIADQHGIEIMSCAETRDLLPYGVQPGKCVDNELLQRVFGLDVSQKKDPAQREACGCVVSRDIGMYDSCLFGCQYCYATSSFARARSNYAAHDPLASSLLG